MIWQATPEQLPLLEAFFAQETEAASASIPDLFLRLQSPFENPRAHGYALREELIAQYQAAKPELEAAEVEASWVCPHARPEDDDVSALVRALVSFHQHHEEDITLLAIWLDPSANGDMQGYAEWLLRLALHSDAKLRFWLADAGNELSRLAQAAPAHIKAEECELDPSDGLSDLAAHAGGDTPGDAFRALLLQIGSASGSGDTQLGEMLTAKATELALSQGWPHLAAAAKLCLASGFLGKQMHIEALRSYTDAERLGEQTAQQAATSEAEGSEEEKQQAEAQRTYAQHIRLQARLGQGATLLAHQAFAHAAEVYLHAVPFAEATADMRMQLDCLRLAGLCFDRAGEPQKGWACGMRGFALGAAMDAETRGTSTLPFLSDQLLRVTERAEYSAHREPIEQQTVRLLGPSWRDALEVG